MGRLRVHGTFVACGDCEADSGGIIAQPANTASSLGYPLAGAALAGRHAHRPRDLIFAGMVAPVGVGSVAFHGPGGRFSLWLHDAAMIGLLTTVNAGNLGELTSGPLAPEAIAAAGTVAAASITRSPTSIRQRADRPRSNNSPTAQSRPSAQPPDAATTPATSGRSRPRSPSFSRPAEDRG